MCDFVWRLSQGGEEEGLGEQEEEEEVQEQSVNSWPENHSPISLVSIHHRS